MKFRKILDKKELQQIDFSLPKTIISPELSAKLKNSKSTFKIFVAGPAWGVKEWVGKIYPPKTRSADYLKSYSEAFNCIELNSLHYRLQEPKTIISWREESATDFTFCPKVSQSISHYGKLTDKIEVDHYFDVVSNFGEKLGIIFMQLSENFSPNCIGDLKKFLEIYPKEFKLAIELRHEAWFWDKSVFKLFEEYGISSVITDVGGRRDVLHMNITADEVVIRFVGNNLDESDYTRIDLWIERLKDYKEMGIKKVYFFIHEPDDVMCPEMASYFIDKVNESSLDSIKPMKFYEEEQQSLL